MPKNRILPVSPKMPFSKKVINTRPFRFYPALCLAFLPFLFFSFTPLCSSAFQRFLAGEKQS
jgi:hypothetical protein